MRSSCITIAQLPADATVLVFKTARSVHRRAGVTPWIEEPTADNPEPENPCTGDHRGAGASPDGRRPRRPRRLSRHRPATTPSTTPKRATTEDGAPRGRGSRRDAGRGSGRRTGLPAVRRAIEAGLVVEGRLAILVELDALEGRSVTAERRTASARRSRRGPQRRAAAPSDPRSPIGECAAPSSSKPGHQPVQLRATVHGEAEQVEARERRLSAGTSPVGADRSAGFARSCSAQRRRADRAPRTRGPTPARRRLLVPGSTATPGR